MTLKPMTFQYLAHGSVTALPASRGIQTTTNSPEFGNIHGPNRADSVIMATAGEVCGHSCL